MHGNKSNLSGQELRDAIEKLKSTDKMAGYIQKIFSCLPTLARAPVALVGSSAVPATTTVLGFMTSYSKFLLLGANAVNCLCALGCFYYLHATSNASKKMEEYFMQGLALIDGLNTEIQGLLDVSIKMQDSVAKLASELDKANEMNREFKSSNEELGSHLQEFRTLLDEKAREIEQYKTSIASLNTSIGALSDIIRRGDTSAEALEDMLKSMDESVTELKQVEMRLAESSKLNLMSTKLNNFLEKISGESPAGLSESDREELKSLMQKIVTMGRDLPESLAQPETINVDVVDCSAPITAQPRSLSFKQAVTDIKSAMAFLQDKRSGSGLTENTPLLV